VRAPKLVLASGSVARLRVLREAGMDPLVSVSGVDESADGLATEVAVEVLAERKASAVAANSGVSGVYATSDGTPGHLVLGCDSLLDIDGDSFGKPASDSEAAAMWRRLSGRTGILFTGHCLIDDADRRVTAVARTVVHFGDPTDEEMAAYLNTGEPLQLAGAFSIDGLGAPFVTGIEGDASNVLGLSLPLFRKMLSEFGLRVFDLWRTPVPPTLMPPTLRRISPEDRSRIAELIESEWGLPVVSVSGLYDPSRLNGIVAERDGELLGALTYRMDEYAMEVVTLNSLVEGRGIGSALLAEARRIAQASRRRLWLITTNENLRAISFYQRRGMEMAALHRNFADEVRRSKPGAAGIAFRHAIEFEYPLID
jgi:septum formation protein